VGSPFTVHLFKNTQNTEAYSVLKTNKQTKKERKKETNKKQYTNPIN